MAWVPAHAIINARAIAANLLTYFETNQADALAWANGGTGLKSFQRIENSIGNLNEPFYPAIMFNQDNDVADYTDELVAGAYTVTFELMVTNSDPNTAVTQARVYEAAVKSMIRNCPQSTYTANTGALASGAVLNTLEAGFDPIKSNETRNDFMQQFQIRATFTLTASAL